MTRWLAVLSDSHDNQTRMKRVRELLREKHVSTAIHCGDICSPKTVLALSDISVHWVFGNCDWNREALAEAAAECGHELHGDQGAIEIGKKKLGFCHGHISGQLSDMIMSSTHDYVFHGHSHSRRDEVIGRTHVFNPGAIHRSSQPGFLLVDPEGAQSCWIDLD